MVAVCVYKVCIGCMYGGGVCVFKIILQASICLGAETAPQSWGCSLHALHLICYRAHHSSHSGQENPILTLNWLSRASFLTLSGRARPSTLPQAELSSPARTHMHAHTERDNDDGNKKKKNFFIPTSLFLVTSTVP